MSHAVPLLPTVVKESTQSHGHRGMGMSRIYVTGNTTEFEQLQTANMKLSYRRDTARHTIGQLKACQLLHSCTNNHVRKEFAVGEKCNTYLISRRVRVRKVSNNKTDIQDHSSSLVGLLLPTN